MELNNQLENKFKNYKDQIFNAISQVVKIDQKLQTIKITQDSGRVSRIKSEAFTDPKQYAKQNAIKIKFINKPIPLISDLNSQNKTTELEYLISQLEEVEANITDNHNTNFMQDLSLITDRSEVQEPFIEQLGKTVISNQIDESVNLQKTFSPMKRRPLQLIKKQNSRNIKRSREYLTLRIDSLELQQKFSKKDDYIGLVIVYQDQLYNQSLKRIIQQDVQKFVVKWNETIKLQEGEGMITCIFNYKNDDIQDYTNISQFNIQRINSQLQEVEIKIDCYQILKYQGVGIFKYQFIE